MLSELADETAPKADAEGTATLPARRAYPPSVQAGIPVLSQTPEGWTRFQLGELVVPIERPATLVDERTYQLVTAKRNREGIVARERLRGDQIKTKTQFVVEAGDFLVSNRQISHGGCGFVPDHLNGALVSNEYTALRTTRLLDPRFLNALSHSVYFQQTCFHSSVGVHVEKLVFRLQDWLKRQFNIPPLDEQRRIADVLDSWKTAIDQTERLIAVKRHRKAALLRQVLPLESNGCAKRSVTLGDLGEIIRGVTYDPETALTSADDGSAVGVCGSTEIQNSILNTEFGLAYVKSETVDEKQILQVGDFVVCASNGSKNLVGKAGRLEDDKANLTAGGFCLIFRPKDRTSGDLAQQIFSSERYRRYLHVELSGSAIGNLYASSLAAMRFDLGVANPAEAIRVLAFGDAELRGLTKSKSLLEAQKRGLTQKLLSGQWRLDQGAA